MRTEVYCLTCSGHRLAKCSNCDRLFKQTRQQAAEIERLREALLYVKQQEVEGYVSYCGMWDTRDKVEQALKGA